MKNQLVIYYWSAILLSLGALTSTAFAPPHCPQSKIEQKLEASRRDVLGSVLLGTGAWLLPQNDEAKAFSQQLDDYAFEPQQQATDGKFDLNAAFVVSIMRVARMSPCYTIVDMFTDMRPS